MTDLSRWTPSAIDTVLADIWGRQQRIQHSRDATRKRSNRYLDQGYGLGSPQVRDAEALQESYEIELAELENEAFPYEAEYATRGWRRFFLVTNQNGHIHTSMSCSTCFHDTQFAWLPEYSGLTDEEIVAKEAYRACTVCLPIAPAEQKAARERYTREQREARRAEKEAKANEKLLKAAQRAEKFLAKVEKVVAETFGGNYPCDAGWETLWNEYSLYGKDGKKSLYEATFDMPAQVGNYLYDEMAVRESSRLRTVVANEGTGGRVDRVSRHFKDPKATIAEAREKGLI